MATRHPKTVLVLEDDAAIQDLMRDLLCEEGYRVLQATDGLTGLCLAEQHDPDAILLDLGLPPTSGLDVLAELKGNRATNHIPVVAVSGRAVPIRHGEGVDLDGFIEKPFDIDRFLEHVERVVN